MNGLEKKILKGMKSGKGWYGVESKSFRASVEVVKERVEGIVLGHGFSSWIKFGEKSLSLFLERVESCC